MEILSVVQHLHSLAINPRNRASIVKDQGCLPGLVIFLDNKDSQVLLTAVKTLHLLALHGPNRTSMKDELGMLPSLKLLISNPDPEIKKYATDVHSLLNGNSKSSSRATHGGTSSYFLGNSNSRAKVITLQVRGLHQATRKICEEQLLQVRGVISFTFNMSKARCIVRVKPDINAEQLCQKISDTKIMAAQQIIKNVAGEETVLSFGKNPVIPAIKEEKEEFPDYLPETDENLKHSEKVLVRNDQSGKSESGGWFSGVSNFISSTLYW